MRVPVFRGGVRAYSPPAIGEALRRAGAQLAGLHGGVKRLMNPHQYPAGLERALFDLKSDPIMAARRKAKRARTRGRGIEK